MFKRSFKLHQRKTATMENLGQFLMSKIAWRQQNWLDQINSNRSLYILHASTLPKSIKISCREKIVFSLFQFSFSTNWLSLGISLATLEVVDGVMSSLLLFNKSSFVNLDKCLIFYLKRLGDFSLSFLLTFRVLLLFLLLHFSSIIFV